MNTRKQPLLREEYNIVPHVWVMELADTGQEETSRRNELWTIGWTALVKFIPLCRCIYRNVIVFRHRAHTMFIMHKTTTSYFGLFCRPSTSNTLHTYLLPTLIPTKCTIFIVILKT